MFLRWSHYCYYLVKKNKSKKSKPTSLSRTNAFLKKENKQTNRQKRMVRELVRVIPQKKIDKSLDVPHQCLF